MSKASFASITHMMIMGDKKKLESLNPSDTKHLEQQLAASELPTFLQKTIEAVEPARLHSILTTHFTHIQQSPLASAFSFSYTIFAAAGQQDITVQLHKKPITAEDFYQLAMAIGSESLYDENPFTVTQAGVAVDAATLNKFQYSLLQDAALAGHPAAKQQLTLLAKEAACLSRFDFLYSYKEDTLILLSGKPTTAEEFYQLALRIANHAIPAVYICNHNGTTQANAPALRALQFSLFNDAAKAGHSAARNAIINAVIQSNDADARKYFFLEKFNILGYNIQLPRKFETIEDYNLLGTALIICKNSLAGQPLRGQFFEIEDGAYAERLGRRLLELVASMRKNSDEQRVQATYDAINRVSAALTKERIGNGDLHGSEIKHYSPAENRNVFFAPAASTRPFIMDYASIADELDRELESARPSV